jgi:hypothetical protein
MTVTSFHLTALASNPGTKWTLPKKIAHFKSETILLPSKGKGVNNFLAMSVQDAQSWRQTHDHTG